jgi:hypothetical protein
MLPPEKILSPQHPADTSCVTGLPARTIYRSCRIFLFETLEIARLATIRKEASTLNIVGIYDTKHEENTRLRGIGFGHNGSVSAVVKPV